MHRDPVSYADTDRSNFSIVDPHASQARPCACGDSEFGQGFCHERFNPTQITMEILSASSQIDDRVADELTRTVIGGLASAIDRKEWIRKVGYAPETRSIRRATNRVNWFVLQ